ncbi:MAG: FKBP-type peptidyl-prolyl cis-trans isomerase [Pseudomonadales bacterium]
MSKYKVVFAAAIVLSLLGCSNPEEEAFRASLIDKALNDDNRKLGDAYLARNAQREEVRVLGSGLQYEVLQSGSGPQPKMHQKVEVSYRGELVSGEVFDSSLTRGKSSVFPLTEVIPGWRIALLKMRAGDRWKVYLPAELGYGARSPSEQIAANSALVFDIELLKIVSDENE